MKKTLSISISSVEQNQDKKLVDLLRNNGYAAGLANYGKKPSIRTDAPWDVIVKLTLEVHPPM